MFSTILVNKTDQINWHFQLKQRIFKQGDIRNTTLTPDEELNILMHGMPSYVILYMSYELLNGPVLPHPVQ